MAKLWFLNKYFCVAVSVLMLLACGGGGGGGSSSKPTPNISVSRSVDFGGIILDNNADRILEIRNTGSANLTVGPISQPNPPFSIVSDNCSSSTLSPSQPCSITVRFSPTDQSPIDPFTSEFSIPSNDPDSGNVNITLSGEGYGLNVWINEINSGSCPEMNAEVTVTNPRTNDLLTSIPDQNFTLHQNGQLITNPLITNTYPTPVSVVLALDGSPSASSVLPQIRGAAKSFIGMLGLEDEAAICKFTSDIDLDPTVPPLFITADDAGKLLLNTYIDDSFPTGALSTSLYDAVYQSIDRAEQGPIANRRAVVLLSDGIDSGSIATIDELITHAKANGISVFTILYFDPLYAGNSQVMQRLAAETGGQYYNGTTASLESIFQQISNVLSNKYTITYTSPTCSGTLDVRVVDGNGLYGQASRNMP